MEISKPVGTNRCSGRRRVVLLVVVPGAAGMLAALSFEPFGFGWLAPVSMVLVWLSMQKQDRAQSVFVAGACFGAVFSSVLMWWLIESIGLIAWAAMTLVMAAAIAVAALAVKAVSNLPAAPLWAAAIWTGVEELRSSWPLGGMPWGRLGVAAIDTPWQPLLPYLGISGTGFLTAWMGFAIADAYLRRGARALPLVVMPIAVVAVVAATPHSLQSEATIAVAVVQGGVPGDGTDLATYHQQVTRNHVNATIDLAASLHQRGESVDVVIWPENSTAVDPLRRNDTATLINHAVETIDAPILVGGIFDGPDAMTAYNRGLLFKPGGALGGAYTKTHVVPFGEYIPWRSVIGTWFKRFDEIPRDMLPGQAEGPINVEETPMAVAICFDIAYDDVLAQQVRAGAQFVVVQTSNATFFGTTQPEQQFEITRARAVELGRSIVVASTNGVSAVVSADGSIVERLPVGVTATLTTNVSLYSSLTPAVQFQTIREDVLAGLALLGLFFACLLRASRFRRRRTSVGPRPTC